MKVSIACPTFEYYGRGVEVLDDMFRTIANQTLKDFNYLTTTIINRIVCIDRRITSTIFITKVFDI